MSRSFRPFNTYTGKNTFGVLKESQTSGEYTINKKASAGFCPPNVCVPSQSIATQSNRLLLKRANALYFSSCHNPYNSANLNINLVTQLDLSGCRVIFDASNNTQPASLSVSSIPYLDYVIDPSGNLFGNTLCGATNFTEYLTYIDASNNLLPPFTN